MHLFNRKLGRVPEYHKPYTKFTLTLGMKTSSRIMVAPINIPLHRTIDSMLLKSYSVYVATMMTAVTMLVT